jgi:hypothetical protein
MKFHHQRSSLTAEAPREKSCIKEEILLEVGSGN